VKAMHADMVYVPDLRTGFTLAIFHDLNIFTVTLESNHRKSTSKNNK